MQEREPSRTALGAAKHRAAHQILEQGRVFADPLAVAVLGEDPTRVAEEAEDHPSRRGMRFFVAARSEFAEAMLKEAVEARGVRQLVVLGAGLDTFACRNPFAGLGVFEVDLPATQAWKRRRLAEAGVQPPVTLNFVPLDFERDDLLDRLGAAGFDPLRRAFFTWLGVVPYLSEDAVMATLQAIAALPGGGEVVFDYSDPPETLAPEHRARYEQLAVRVADAGEPFRTSFVPADLHARLRAGGFEELRDLGVRELVARHFGERAARLRGLPERGGHVIHASTPSPGH